MPAIAQKDEAAARAYASAMFDLAEARGQGDDLLAELRDLTGYLDENAEFGAFATGLTADMAARERVFEKLFRGKYADLFVDSLQVLNQRDRLGLLPAIAEAYHQLHKVARGRVEVFVRSAVALSDPLRKRIAEFAGRYTGRKADLLETVDESLIGGVSLQIGDQKFDTSLRRRLKILHDGLMERASRELHDGRTYFEGGAV